MKLEQSITIEGNVVVLQETLCNGDIEVYKQDYDGSDVTLYFVRVSPVDGSKEVMFKQVIEAEMGQGVGYVSDITFTD